MGIVQFHVGSVIICMLRLFFLNHYIFEHIFLLKKIKGMIRSSFSYNIVKNMLKYRTLMLIRRTRLDMKYTQVHLYLV